MDFRYSDRCYCKDILQQSPVSHPARVEKVLYGGEDEEEEDEDDEYEQQDMAPKTPKKSKDQSSQQRVVEYKDGLTVAVETDDNFCLMLPLSPGNRDDNGGEDDPSAIADSEKSARAFCTNENVNVPGASTLPPGFITSAHFAQDLQKGFVQVRGSIDRDAYSLSSSDSGGQVMNIRNAVVRETMSQLSLRFDSTMIMVLEHPLDPTARGTPITCP